MNKKTILITGATGMVASKLIPLLTQKGFAINTLSRLPINQLGVKSYLWDVSKNIINEEAVLSANFIIHLAGENVAAKRWTAERKKAILESRISSTNLLFSVLEKHKHLLDGYVGASAIGYYGDRGQENLSEDCMPKKSFLSDVCVAWEQAHLKMSQFSNRVIIFRIGVVLDKKEGALKEMMQTLPLSLSCLGNGEQSTSYIHIDDLIKMIAFGIENTTMNGVYNAVNPEVVSNKELIKTLSQYKKSVLPITSVPSFMLKIIMGEAATIALGSQNCSADKIVRSGFSFSYPTINLVFKNLFENE